MSEPRTPRGRSRERTGTSAAESTFAQLDDQIMREADKQRAHDLKLAEVSARRDAELARLARDRAEHRNTVIGWVLAGLLVAVVVLAIIVAIHSATSQDRRDRDEQRQRDVEVAELCVREGNIWVDGDCLIARRDVN